MQKKVIEQKHESGNDSFFPDILYNYSHSDLAYTCASHGDDN